MLGNLFKPKWQHSDAKVRIQALDTLAGDSAELIALAQHDPHSAVRMEAVMHLTHLPTLIQIGHTPGSIGERARQRVISLASSDSRHDEQLAKVFNWLQQNPTLLRSISRDAERGSQLRKQAIRTIDDQELLAEIANQDPSREIQYLAASRLTDLDQLKQLEKNHGRNNKRLRQLLKERIAQEQQRRQQQAELDKLCTEAESLCKSEAWDQNKTRAKVLEQSWGKLATHADEAQQQRFQSALADFQQRLQAHVNREQQLEPIRKIQNETLSAAAILEQQLKETPESRTPDDLDAAIKMLAAGWEQQEKLPPEEQARQNSIWEKQYQRLTSLRNTLRDDLVALETLNKLHAKAETLKKQDKPLSGKEILALQTDWVNTKRPQNLGDKLPELENSFRHCMDTLNKRLEKQKKHQEETLKTLHDDLKNLENFLENEHYSEAIELHHDFTRRLKETPELPRKDAGFFQRRIQMLTPYIRELQDWRRWGTDQVRKQLIETAEHLREEDDLDPEERAKRVQSLRDEWRKLSNMEPHQQRKLWKEFDTTVSAAYEPSKQHFAKQARQREQHLQQRQVICAELEALDTDTDWENVDWREQQNTLNALRKRWKNAGTVSHKDWKHINQRFNAAMDALDIHFKAERNRNWREREQLVARAKELLEQADTAEAIRQSKALQKEWNVTIPSRHADEQKLWKQFREPIDALFARAQEERQQKRDTYREQAAEEQRQQEERKQKEREKQQQHLAELDELAIHSATRKQTETDPSSMSGNRSEGESLLLQLEILLELPTPAPFKQARMEFQVSQMSEAMLSRRDNSHSLQSAINLLKQWYKLGGMPADDLQSQTARIDAVRQAIQENIQSAGSAG